MFTFLDGRKIDGTVSSSSKSVQDNLQQQHTFQQIASSSNIPNSGLKSSSSNVASQQAAAAAQLMKAVAASGGAASQIVGSAAGVSPHMYMTPFQPNFFNSPFLSMANLQASQSNQASNISGGSNNSGGTKMFGSCNYPSSSAAAFNVVGSGVAAAANGLSPIPSSSAISSSGNFGSQQKSVDQSLLSAQQQTRHKIYELKAASQAASPALMLTSGGIINNTGVERSDLNNSTSGGRSSVAGANLGNTDASSPLRPSSAIPSSSGNQRGIKIFIYWIYLIIF